MIFKVNIDDRGKYYFNTDKLFYETKLLDYDLSKDYNKRKFEIGMEKLIDNNIDIIISHQDYIDKCEKRIDEIIYASDYIKDNYEELENKESVLRGYKNERSKLVKSIKKYKGYIKDIYKYIEYLKECNPYPPEIILKILTNDNSHYYICMEAEFYVISDKIIPFMYKYNEVYKDTFSNELIEYLESLFKFKSNCEDVDDYINKKIKHLCYEINCEDHIKAMNEDTERRKIEYARKMGIKL